MAIEFEITDRRIDDETHVIAVAGEIDLFTAPEFKQRVGAPIDDGIRTIVVDLSKTTFVDSSSLGVLIDAHKRLKIRKGELVVVVDDKTIRNTFKVTGLDGLFSMVRTREEALQDD